MTAMKWWGWGHEHVAFTHEDKPELAPFIRKWLDVDIERPTARPMRVRGRRGRRAEPP